MDKSPIINDILKLVILNSYSQSLFFQNLIDEWKEPENISQRCAVMLLDTHNSYGVSMFRILKILETEQKNTSKMVVTK